MLNVLPSFKYFRRSILLMRVALTEALPFSASFDTSPAAQPKDSSSKLYPIVLTKPKTIRTDKHSSYIKAISQLRSQKILPKAVVHRQCKYLNNIIESDHRRIKRITNPMLGFKTINSAKRCIEGIEAVAMMVKRQTHYLKLSILEQIQFVKRLFNFYI
ncbi:MAG: DDE-type integrase/transposase/recombinase [Janthinobacterium lividum]